MAEPFVGQIVLFAGPYYPNGWAPCFGQTMLIQEYPDLFAVLSTTYGGNGSTYFNLPDLRGRAPVGTGELSGSPNLASGDLGGQNSVAITLANLPAHNHPLHVSSVDATTSAPQGSYLATAVDNSGTGGVANFVYGTDQGATANAGAIGFTGGTPINTIPLNENVQPILTQPPYLAINYIIALIGTFPQPSTLFKADFVPQQPAPAPNGP